MENNLLWNEVSLQHFQRRMVGWRRSGRCNNCWWVGEVCCHFCAVHRVLHQAFVLLANWKWEKQRRNCNFRIFSNKIFSTENWLRKLPQHRAFRCEARDKNDEKIIQLGALQRSMMSWWSTSAFQLQRLREQIKIKKRKVSWTATLAKELFISNRRMKELI